MASLKRRWASGSCFFRRASKAAITERAPSENSNWSRKARKPSTHEPFRFDRILMRYSLAFALALVSIEPRRRSARCFSAGVCLRSLTLRSAAMASR